MENTIDNRQIMVGSLLKLKTVDNVDFSLIVEDFEKKTNYKVKGSWGLISESLDEFRKYIIIFEDGKYQLRDGISLDNYIEGNCTLREKLKNYAGDIVNGYYESLDIEKFNEEKKRKISDNKQQVTENANVLLISDTQEDYEEIKKYGFKNVDYFKSIIRADNYFSIHPEELEKYHIIFEGSRSVAISRVGECDLLGKILQLKDTTDMLCLSLHRSHAIKYDEVKNEIFCETLLVSYLNDKYNGKFWPIKEKEYKDFFDRISEIALINHTMEKVGLKEFMGVKNVIKQDKLSLPSKKQELKILYLDSANNKYRRKIAKALGLNITFRNDNNFALEKYVEKELGYYDIIIASYSFSHHLLRMDKESIEQCKDTGRNLTLLITYDDHELRQLDEDDKTVNLGSKVALRYIFAGSMEEDSDIDYKEFRVLRKNTDIIPKDEERKKYYEYLTSVIMSVVSSSVDKYNEKLLQMNEPGIRDFDLKRPTVFDEEYEAAAQAEKERKENAIKPIREFDDIMCEIFCYLKNKKEGLIDKEPEGLIISETEDGIIVENIYEGIVRYVITFKKEYGPKNLRIFEMQAISKKGKMFGPEMVGLYTRKYKKLEGIPKKPNKYQIHALKLTYQKVYDEIRALNEGLYEKATAKILKPIKKESLPCRKKR